MKLRGFYLAGKVAAYSDDFFTPDHIPAALGRFDLDPCAGPKDHAKINIRKPDDGLAMEWRGRVWLNPPYSNIHEWLEKFIAHGNGICLVNARCETNWFQSLALACDAVFFPRGRINFERPGLPATHPPCGSALLAIGRRNVAALSKTRLQGVFCSSLRVAA